jgi:hypothetical protein
MLAMERDPNESGSDVGRDIARDLGDEPPALIRDAAPDVLAPIDESSPVSGHVPATTAAGGSPADAPEHDWSAAKGLIRPAFRPAGTQGLAVTAIDRDTLAAHTSVSHAQPIIDEGPVGLVVVYTIPADGYDIVVNGDHLLSWGIAPSELQDAALANLAAWAETAPWTEEDSGERHLVSSDTGEGMDAVRILLPGAIAHLEARLASYGRILVGLPERHLLAAAALGPNDPEFAELFSEFVIEQSGGADEPIDRRVFELVGGRLVDYAG